MPSWLARLSAPSSCQEVSETGYSIEGKANGHNVRVPSNIFTDLAIHRGMYVTVNKV